MAWCPLIHGGVRGVIRGVRGVTSTHFTNQYTAHAPGKQQNCSTNQEKTEG